MALELIARIWARPRDEIDAGEKWVLTVMADRADQDGLLWYAIDTIADKTSYTSRAVRKIMDRLIAKGLVKKLQRRDRSNYYIIQVDKFPLAEPRKARPKEVGPAEYVTMLEGEPDLFGTGEPRSGRVNDVPQPLNDVPPTDEPGSANSLTDSLIDPPIDAQAREGGETIYEMVARRWNELADEHAALAPIRPPLSEARRKAIDARTKEWRLKRPSHDVDVLDPDSFVWDWAFKTIGLSKLLTGNKTSWAPTLDWMLGPKNFTKIMEGNYGHGHDRIGAATNDARDRSAVTAGREARDLVERTKQRRAGQGAGGHSPRAAGAHS